MEEFKAIEKKIFWLALITMQCIALVYKAPIGIQLFVNSVCCVALGSLYAIHFSKGKRIKLASEDEETLSTSDALKFPFMASGALLVLYILFKNINNDILVYLFKINFGFMGASVIGSFLTPKIDTVFPHISNVPLYKNKLKVLGHEQEFDITMHSAIAYSISGLIGLLYVLTSHWTLNNLLGVCFTIGGIMLLKVSKFSTVMLLLWLLFFYDIFWVFGSDVMVTVAKKFDVPIKLLFPVGDNKFSILGLGDMVIPGILTALALKFDVDVALDQKNGGHLNCRTPVFNAVLIGYALGIVATFVGMTFMNHAQPALLYLVPTCSIGLLYGLLSEKRIQQALKYESELTDKPKEN